MKSTSFSFPIYFKKKNVLSSSNDNRSEREREGGNIGKGGKVISLRFAIKAQ